MKFLLTFTITPQRREETVVRFQKTGGQPPAGVKLLGRWTAADLSGGFALLESSDSKALTESFLARSDLLELTMIPVIEDAELAEVLKRARE